MGGWGPGRGLVSGCAGAAAVGGEMGASAVEWGKWWDLGAA